MVAKEPYNGRFVRTHKLSKGLTIQRAARCFAGSNREFRIYPINSKTKYTKVSTEVAWKEGMTIEEFEEYLYD